MGYGQRMADEIVNRIGPKTQLFVYNTETGALFGAFTATGDAYHDADVFEKRFPHVLPCAPSGGAVGSFFARRQVDTSTRILSAEEVRLRRDTKHNRRKDDK
jgi:hypothetical protein